MVCNIHKYCPSWVENCSCFLVTTLLGFNLDPESRAAPGCATTAAGAGMVAVDFLKTQD